MEPGYSIQLIWPLASREAMDFGYEHIEPVHLFIALLKFAELGSREMEPLFKDKAVLTGLLEEQEAVREILKARGLLVPQGTPVLRRRLRKKMGPGGFKHEHQGMVHRSEASRGLCRRAEELAAADGALTWQAAHLVAAMIENPQDHLDVLKSAKAELKVRKAERVDPVETPLLDRCGSSYAAKGPAGQKTADPAVRVILDSLRDDSDSSLILIEMEGRTALKVVEEVASRREPDERRLVCIDLIGLGDASKVSALLAGLLEEAARAQAVIYLGGLPDVLDKGYEAAITAVLEQILTERQVRCLCAVNEAAYSRWFEKKQPWRRLFRPVWLHPVPEPPW